MPTTCKPTAGKFATLRNAQNVLVQSATVGMAALGMTMIIISGGIDLSAGTTMALSRHGAGLVPARRLSARPWRSPPALATGCLAGFVNGTLISLLRVVPFIVTLGTMTIYLGLAKIDRPEHDGPARRRRRFPTGCASCSARGLQTSGCCLRRAFGCCWCWPWWWRPCCGTRVFGRHVFAVGSNEVDGPAVRHQRPLTRIAVYTIAGFFVGMAGLYQFARLTIGDPTSGTGKELPIIAAVVIGGGSLNGGRGSILGTLTGALIMQVISSGCTALKQPNPIQEIIIGAIIVAAVTVDQFRQRRLAG